MDYARRGYESTTIHTRTGCGGTAGCLPNELKHVKGSSQRTMKWLKKVTKTMPQPAAALGQRECTRIAHEPGALGLMANSTLSYVLNYLLNYLFAVGQCLKMLRFFSHKNYE